MSDNDHVHPPGRPRRHEHVVLVRWRTTDRGEQVMEEARGEFLGGDDRIWRLRGDDGTEAEYALNEWMAFH